MPQGLSDIVRWALELKENSLFSPPERDLSTNADLIGQSYHSRDAVIQVVSLDPARPEKYVIVQDLVTDKRWSAPAGLIRLAIGNKSRRKKAA